MSSLTGDNGAPASKPPHEAGAPPTIAALFVERGGVYTGVEGVRFYDGVELPLLGESYYARSYAGPWPVVAHPPCKRWGRYWSGGPSAKVRRKLGDDGGCFEAALRAVRTYGGVLEHPEASHAWRVFGLERPPRSGGWIRADDVGGMTCCVAQGHYEHPAQKLTWLYAVRCELPDLIWGPCEGKLRLEQGGATRNREEARATRAADDYAPAARISSQARFDTPIPFRDVLVAMARSVR